MTPRTTLRPWQEKALHFFEELPTRVFTRADLTQILSRKSYEFDAPGSLSSTRFITFLEEHGRLKHVEINPAPREKISEPVYKNFSRYVWGIASPLEVGLS